MIKERMMRSLPNLMVAIMLAAGVSLCVAVLPGTGLGSCQWKIVDKYPPPTNLDPNEVIVYEHANFVGRYIRFKLQPGMRQLHVPGLPEDMNDVISSIQVGSKVAVMVFRDANFENISGHMGAPGPGKEFAFQLAEKESPIFESEKTLYLNDDITSLIVIPKEIMQPIGVMLGDRGSTDWGIKFFPLPEFLSQTEAKYSTLPNMNDDANVVTLYPNNPNFAAFGKVQVTLYEHADFKGRNITLPGADGSMPPDASFGLGSYQFDDSASSLVVRWVDNSPAFQPPPPAPPPPSTAHATAPPAPDTKTAPPDRTPPPPSVVTPPDVSGQWKSSIGLVYNITQAGDQFEWTVENSNEQGQGTIKGNNVSASWKGQQGVGSSAGKLTTDSSGRATEVKWNNGVRFYR
jgi:hypothetical protein